VTITFHALWMLCALAGVVFAAVSARDWRQLAAFTIAAAAAMLLIGPARLPDASWVGVAAAAAAAWHLTRPRFAVLSASVGGAVGGLSAAIVELHGAPAPVAIVVVIASLLASAWLALKRRHFAPEAIRDEALVAIMLLGLGVAVVPGILDGWQAAANLTVASSQPESRAAIPAWTVAIVGSATALGAVYSLWSRR
jgi:hypothetical protein